MSLFSKTSRTIRWCEENMLFIGEYGNFFDLSFSSAADEIVSRVRIAWNRFQATRGMEPLQVEMRTQELYYRDGRQLTLFDVN